MTTKLLNTQKVVNISSDPSSATSGEIYYNTVSNSLKFYNGTSWGIVGGGSGTVTSVGISVPTGLSVSGSPITSSGTLALSLTAGYEIPTTTSLSAKAPLASPTFTGTVILPTSATGGASARIPHGTAPTSPTNGDIWTTTTGLFARINGGTVGPYNIGTARTFYQTSAPSTPETGDIWVDSDEVVIPPNTNDFMPKTGGTFSGGVIFESTVTGILPSQTGNSGKFLTTNGTSPSWGTIDLSSKANIASPTFTGVPAAPTATAGTNTTQLATTSFVTTADNLKANLSGATFTGVVTGVSPTTAESIGFRRTTMSTSAPTGGLDGDVWLQHS